jgi:hypothetical protein
MVPDFEPRTYYDRPVLKEPTWKWEVPAYFFTGGLAAGSALLAGGAELVGDRAVADRMRIVASGATVASGALLVADLGKPSRFHHMLRVAKPTSPMNAGAWLLAAFGAAGTVATVTGALDVFPRVRRTATLGAAALAPMLATYTAVLVADTAIPAWHDARAELPFVFAGGAAAGAGAVGVLVLPAESTGPARALLVAGAATEIVASKVMERRLGTPSREVYERGRAAWLSRAATACTALGSAAIAIRRGHGGVARAGAVAVVAGAVLERFAVVAAGRASARDPRYVVAPQRAEMACESASSERNLGVTRGGVTTFL